MTELLVFLHTWSSSCVLQFSELHEFHPVALDQRPRNHLGLFPFTSTSSQFPCPNEATVSLLLESPHFFPPQQHHPQVSHSKSHTTCLCVPRLELDLSLTRSSQIFHRSTSGHVAFLLQALQESDSVALRIKMKLLTRPTSPCIIWPLLPSPFTSLSCCPHSRLHGLFLIPSCANSFLPGALAHLGPSACNAHTGLAAHQPSDPGLSLPQGAFLALSRCH